MNVSMIDYLKVIAPDISGELVSPETFCHIQALAQIFPPCYLAAFECRLGADEPRVDFQVQLPSYLLNLPKPLLQSKLWQDLEGFYRDWAQPTSSFFLHRSVTAVSLEFDLPVGQSLSEPVPCILLTLSREMVTDAQTLIQIALNLPNFPVSSKLESNLRLCYDALPEQARIASAGAMLSRQNQALKLGLKGISPQQLLDYLAKIGWKDTTNQLPPLLWTLSELVDEIGLDVEIGDRVYPRIGLECYFEKQSFSEPRWEVFLDRLVNQGLCTVAKKDALLAWPGFCQKAERLELWPPNLIWGDIFIGSKAFSIFSRTIYEIKIVYNPGEPLLAKAYLVFGHDWFDACTLNGKTLPKKTENPKIEISQYLERVRNYYDRINPIVLKYVGTTYQASLLKTDSDWDCVSKSNLFFAKRAGIKPGDRLLDAGCGVCGPSIDIANNIESVTIDAITLSPEQAKTARELVKETELGDRITVHVGDFHYLLFADEVFDTVLFLESMGYCYDRQRLLSEVYRVLLPGGSLYIKDPFIKEETLSEEDWHSIAEAEEIYFIKVSRMSELIESLSEAGFEQITTSDLTSTVSNKKYCKAMIEVKNGNRFLTEFGKYHYSKFLERPTFFGDVKAYKPK